MLSNYRKISKLKLAKLKKIVPKFRPGQIVQMRDEYSFNPASETISIGVIEAVHIHGNFGSNNFLTPAYQITYSITGFSLLPGEEQLELFTNYIGEINNDN